MKAIFFGCLVIIFGSCTKPTFELNPQPIDFTSTYSWGSYNINVTGDSSNTVNAEITADGITSQFAAAALSTSFARNVYSQNNSDSSVINIFATDDRISTVLRFDLVNIQSEGTYTIDNTPQLHKTVMASYTIGNRVYPGDNTILSGTVTIDTLTSHHIHGLFSITCGNETQTVDIRNGSFTGNF